jgi:hypothetical protein
MQYFIGFFKTEADPSEIWQRFSSLLYRPSNVSALVDAALKFGFLEEVDFSDGSDGSDDYDDE